MNLARVRAFPEDIERDLAILRDPEAHGFVRVLISRPMIETEAQRTARVKAGRAPRMVEFTAVIRREGA